MNLTPFFKSVLEQDQAPVVLCDLNHTILYLNPSARKRYEKQGGEALLGKNLLLCHNQKAADTIKKVLDWFAESNEHNIIYEFRNENENKDVYMVALRDDDEKLIGYYEKHEYRNHETSKLYDFSNQKL